MSKIITDSTGVDIEVFTTEELEAHKQAAVEDYKIEAPEIIELNKQLEEKDKQLEKLKNKDLNFSELRKQKEAIEKEKESITKEIDRKIESVKKEVLEGVMQDHYNETLNALSGGDDELRKKIEFQYKRIADTATTKDEFTRKLTDAFVLATKSDDNALNSSVISSGGVGKLNIKGQDQKFSPEEIELGQKLAQAGGLKIDNKDFK